MRDILEQRGPITGPRTEFLCPTNFLSIDLIHYLYVTGRQFFIKLPAIKYFAITRFSHGNKEKKQNQYYTDATWFSSRDAKYVQ